MIFEKKYRKSTRLLINIAFISIGTTEIVNNYTYLGINFSSNGNFKVCKSNLKDKLRQSFYAIRRYLDFSSEIPSDTTNKFFKWLFQPILLYGSEVWGIYDKDDFTNWEKDVIEKTHILPCKQSLGINKQCPNVAARNELGRLSLKVTIDINMLKCWIHLQNPPHDNIAKQCLQISKDMAEKNQPGISQEIKTLCDEYSSGSMILKENNGKTLISSVAQNLSKAFIDHQPLIMSSNRKLNFYNTFKRDTNRTEFPDAIKNPLHRSAVNKFRLGNHWLLNI